MKFLKLKAKNTYSFRDLELSFEEFAGVTSIILGKSIGEKTANGAGKSSILKILYWVVFGKELNDEKLEDIGNKIFPKDGFMGSIEFTDRGHHFKITRSKSFKHDEKDEIILKSGLPLKGDVLEFLVDGELLMGDSIAKTQSIIQNKIQISPKLFLSSILMAQNSKMNFLEANDTDKKSLLSEMLDLGSYEIAFNKVKDKIKTIENSVGKYETEIERFSEQKKEYEEQLKETIEEEKKILEENKKRSMKIESDILVLKKELEEIKNRPVEDVDYENKKKKLMDVEVLLVSKKEELQKEMLEYSKKSATLTSEIGSIDKEIINLEKELISIVEAKEVFVLKTEDKSFVEILKTKNKELKELELKLSTYNNLEDKDGLLEEIKIQKEVISTLEKELEKTPSKEIRSKIKENVFFLEKLENSFGDTIQKEKEKTQIYLEIDKVSSEISNAKEKESEYKLAVLANENSIEKKVSLENRKKEVELKMVESISLVGEKREVLKKIEEEEKTILEKISIINEKEKKLVEQKRILERLFEKEMSNRNKATEIENKEKEILKLEEDKKNLSRTDIHDNMKKRFKDSIASAAEQIEKRKTLVFNSRKELISLNFWKVGFAPTGIRSFITDDVIELLNRKTQENMNYLFDGNISISFDPESKNSKGELSNKISTRILYNGKEMTFGLLSGGQQQRAILATSLALTEVAESRAGTKLNIRFLDEPFNGIDKTGQQKALTLFNKIAREKDGFFVISHDENFQSLSQKAIYVIKAEDEISRLVSKEEFHSSSNSFGGIINKPKKSFSDRIKEKRESEDA